MRFVFAEKAQRITGQWLFVRMRVVCYGRIRAIPGARLVTRVRDIISKTNVGIHSRHN